MTVARKPLSFGDVEDIARAAMQGKLNDAEMPVAFVPRQLGPLLELLQLSNSGQVPRSGKWCDLNGAAHFVSALEQTAESWVAPSRQHLGFIRSARQEPEGDDRLMHFLMKAKRAGQKIAGLSSAVSLQLVAAMQELENNIHEHAEAPETGLLAYRAESGAFEFVATDLGIGVLQSLRSCKAYAELRDEGKALNLALSKGVSRHGPDCNRGHGFRPIFIGLMNLNGELRFRSGDHAVTMDGTNPNLATSQTAQKVPIKGFFASVRCLTRGRSNRGLYT